MEFRRAADAKRCDAISDPVHKQRDPGDGTGEGCMATQLRHTHTHREAVRTVVAPTLLLCARDGQTLTTKTKAREMLGAFLPGKLAGGDL